MAITSIKRSGIKSGVKYIRSKAGNYLFPWINTNWTLGSTTYGSTVAPPSPFIISAWNNNGEALMCTTGPGLMPAFSNWGASYTTSTQIGYSSYAGSFNGWFLGSGNYSSSSIGYKQTLIDGWTYITGYSSYTGSGGVGAGGYTSAGVPVWLIPYSAGSTGSISYYVLSVANSPTNSWTLNTIGTYSSPTSGYLSKIAMTNDIVACAFSTSSASPSSTLTVRYSSVTPSTGALSTTWNTASFTVTPTGGVNSLVSVNGVFVLSTSAGEIYTSTNAATWTQRVAPNSSQYVLTPESDGYIMRAMLSPNQGNNYSVSYSSDGITWTGMQMFNGSSYVASIGAGKGIRHVAHGTSWSRNY